MWSSNLLLTRVRPSIWIPACEVTWSVLTIVMAKCTNVQQLYALRFFIGLAESTFYPGMQYYLSAQLSHQGPGFLPYFSMTFPLYTRAGLQLYQTTQHQHIVT
jgi:MFS family permease